VLAVAGSGVGFLLLGEGVLATQSLFLAGLVAIALAGADPARRLGAWIGLAGLLCAAGTEWVFIADRMNTVFKFYFLAWVLLAVAASSLLGPWLAGLPWRRPWILLKPGLAWAGVALACLGLGAWGMKGYDSSPWLVAALVLGAAAFLLYPGLRKGPVSWAALGLGLFPASALILAGLASGSGGPSLLPASWMAPLCGGLLASVLWVRVGRGRAAPAPYLGFLLALFFCAGKYPFLAVQSKAAQTMTNPPPGPIKLRLDGLRYLDNMPDRGIPTDFTRDDGQVVRHLWDRVRTNKIVLEAPGVEMYGGLSRISIFSGLPTLLGWEYQVGQQRSGSPAQSLMASNRALADLIYQTPDREQAGQALESLGVGYVCVGRIERRRYPAEGLAKFDGWLPEEFRSGDTVLYRVYP
jgi:uncharacterized membrane protein